MNDIWYYSDNNNSVGPLSFADLSTILAHVPNGKDVLVWQIGFENWKKASTVPELIEFVIKPPPLPSTPPPLPFLAPVLFPKPLVVSAEVREQSGLHHNEVSRTNIVGSIQSDLEQSRSQKPIRENNLFRYIGIAAMIAMFSFSVRYLSHSGSNVPVPDAASIISGNVRAAFVTEGMKTCLKKQEADPENAALSIPKETLNKYCSCYMNGLADITTYEEAISITMTPTLQKKVDKASIICQDSLRKSLLGG